MSDSQTARSGPGRPGIRLGLWLRGPSRWHIGLTAVFLALLSVAPLWVEASGRGYLVTVLTRVVIFGLAAMSLDFVMGYGGMVSLGHAAFLGAGAYTAGALTYHSLDGSRLLGIPGTDQALVTWPLATVVGALLGLVIGGLSLRPDAGTVWLDGADITELSLPQRVHSGVARSYQVSSVFRDFTATENVELALQAMDRHSFRFFRPAARNAGRVERAEVLLDQVGLGEEAAVSAQRLSHGQTRQLEIAMAMASDPRVLLLDEPMAGMAPDEARRLAELIRGLAEAVAVLLVEHDMDVVFSVADRISVLHQGSLIASGDPDGIRADPDVHRLYLRDDTES